MSDFRKVTDSFWASPQISIADVAEAQLLGFALIINNRPEREAEDQVPGDVIAQAAEAAGLDYCAIPVSPGGFREDQVEAMASAVESARGPVLAYCRSGTRSTLLWSLSQAYRGADVDDTATAAACAGYDVGPVRLIMDQLANRT